MRLSRAQACAKVAALAIAAAFAAPAAHASDSAGRAKIDTSRFNQLDRNRDGVLTQDEVRHIRDYARAFIEADQNKDGKLDRDEFMVAESLHDRILLGKYVEDSVLTAKVKAALLNVPELKSFDISVETLRGEVLLSGFLKDESQRQKAMKAVNSVQGVAAVKDAMLVR